MIGDVLDRCVTCDRRPVRLGVVEVEGETWWRVLCGCGAYWLLVESDRIELPDLACAAWASR